MARKRDTLRYEPMYKPGSTEAKPTKRKSMWRLVLRIITLGLVGGDRRGEGKTKEEEA